MFPVPFTAFFDHLHVHVLRISSFVDFNCLFFEPTTHTLQVEKQNCIADELAMLVLLVSEATFLTLRLFEQADGNIAGSDAETI